MQFKDCAFRTSGIFCHEILLDFKFTDWRECRRGVLAFFSYPPQKEVRYEKESKQKKERTEEQYLHLSDAFEDHSQTADVDLRVRVLNINYGHNQELMEKCKILREYAEFVEITKIYTARYVDRTEALNRAIDGCIEKNILVEFLRTYRAEVLGMLLEEFDAKKYERSLREEGREEGRTEGAYQKLVLQISKKKFKGYTVEETADMLEEDIELVGKVYSALEEYDAEKEWDKIAEVIRK